MPSKDRETNNRHQREWYARNRQKKITENHAREDELRQQLRKLKEETPCADCGKNYPYYVMDFDHAGAEKIDGVSSFNFRMELENDHRKERLVPSYPNGRGIRLRPGSS